VRKKAVVVLLACSRGGADAGVSGNAPLSCLAAHAGLSDPVGKFTGLTPPVTVITSQIIQSWSLKNRELARKLGFLREVRVYRERNESYCFPGMQFCAFKFCHGSSVGFALVYSSVDDGSNLGYTYMKYRICFNRFTTFLSSRESV